METIHLPTAVRERCGLYATRSIAGLRSGLMIYILVAATKCIFTAQV
jgi:hypothetical protein